MAEFKPTASSFSGADLSSDQLLLLCPQAAQAAADLQMQKLHLLFGILTDVDGFPDAALLREVAHNASQLLHDAAALYRQAIAQVQEDRR